MTRVRLVASDLPAADLPTLENFGIHDIENKAMLDEAVANGSKVWTLNEKTQGPGELVFDGREWTADEPKAVSDSGLPASVEMPTYEALEAYVEVLQSENEALVNALSGVLPARTITALKKNQATARVAMQRAEPVAMAQIAQVLSDTPSASLFSVERAEELNATA